MPLPKMSRGSHYYMTHRCTIITRIKMDEGIVGECYNGDEFETQGEVLKIINDEFAPRVVGMDVFNLDGCWETMLPSTYNIQRDRNLALCAQACVDSAILDAWGKALSLYRLWGGYRDSLPVLAIAGYYEEGKQLADFGREMETLREMGLAGCKFKVGGRSPAEDAERVKVARDAVGSDFTLAVDANQGWTQREAIAFGRLVESCDLRWFEEPCR